MRVTAYVLCHRLDQYVDRAIASVVTQTRLPDDIVLLGTDCRQETAAALRRWEYHPARPRVLMSPQPLTCAQSKNFAGMGAKFPHDHSLCTEQAFFVLDADDWLLPHFVQRCMAYMEGGSASVVGCDYQVLKPDGVLGPSSTNSLKVWDMDRGNPLPACSIVRLSAYLEAGGYREDLIYEDWALWCWLRHHGHQLFRWPQTLFTHVRHDANITNFVSPEVGREQIQCLMSSLTGKPSAPGSSGSPTESIRC